MTDPAMLVVASSTALAALAVTCAALLRAWRGWLDLKQLELDAGRRSSSGGAAKQDLVELKERIRKLEAIASGIEF